jgi:hypothetical protein
MADNESKPIFNNALDWLMARFNERTTWDGLTIIIISIIALIATPLIRYAAWIGLGYGIWTLWKKEKIQ